MNNIVSRRRVLLALVSILPLVSGCGDNSPEPYGRLSIGADTYREDEQWKSDLWVHHESELDSDFHNVTVVGYARNGEELCRMDIGDSTGPTGISERFTIDCDSFPYFFVVIADEDPCEEGLTFEIIRWNGTDKQQRITVPDNVATYEEFKLRCGEKIPPDRLLPNNGTNELDNGTD